MTTSWDLHHAELWSVCQREVKHVGDDPGYAFFEAGLYVNNTTTSASEAGYDSIPAAARVFGSTGGDGETFSFVPQGDDGYVVVLTAPMAFDRPNLVVGDSVRDFLRLGCHLGFYALSQAIYSPRRLVDARALYRIDAEAGTTLRPLVDHYRLEPCEDIPAELERLSAVVVDLAR